MSVGHYENFPVASVVLPAALRAPVTVIYRFARSADDIADEGDADADARLRALATYRERLDSIAAGAAQPPGLFADLAHTIAARDLPLAPFYDLISAFSQDVVTQRYVSFTDLLDYCRRSANPIGALMLHLFGAATPANLARSDSICSALQLINFWQDVRIDWDKGRVYIPAEDLARFGVADSQIAAGEVDARWRALMDFEIERARTMLESGAPLVRSLAGRIGVELRMIVQGGLRILEKLDRVGGDVYRHRPTLGTLDWPLIVWRGLRM